VREDDDLASALGEPLEHAPPDSHERRAKRRAASSGGPFREVPALCGLASGLGLCFGIRDETFRVKSLEVVNRADLVELAESSTVYEPLKHGEELLVTDRFVLSLGRTEATVQRLRLVAEDPPGTVEGVRQRALHHGCTAITWEVSAAATPVDLAERLVTLGVLPAHPPVATVMGLVEPPAPAPDGIRVSRVETVADFRTFVAVTHEVFGIQERLADELERIDREGEHDVADTGFVRHLAWVEDEPVAAGAATFTDRGAILHAGSTREAWRGRGAYRALVAARWRDAVRRGTPALVTRAGPMSQPILARLGFEELCELRLFVDRLDC
jgi:hypothetical protein